MPLRRGLIQEMFDGGACPEKGVGLQSKLLGHAVGGVEPDAVDVTGEPVRIGADEFDRLGSVGLVDADGTVGSEAMSM